MAEEKKITLKLFVDGKTKKLVYAEAKNDFVDFLFGLLQLPIGSIIRSLRVNQKPAPGSLGRVLDSIRKLDARNFQSPTLKDTILNPTLVGCLPDRATKHVPPLFLKQIAAFEESNNGNTASYSGYIKDVDTPYMVTDDLTVSPMSTANILSILNTIGFKGNGSLEEKIVKVDFKMGLELVKASWASDTVFTDVFMQEYWLTNISRVEIFPYVWRMFSFFEEFRVYL